MGCVNSASRSLKERCNQLEDRTRNLEENLSDLTMSRVVVKVNLIEGVEEEEEGRVVVNYQGGKVLEQDQIPIVLCAILQIHFFEIVQVIVRSSQKQIITFLEANKVEIKSAGQQQVFTYMTEHTLISFSNFCLQRFKVTKTGSGAAEVYTSGFNRAS